MKRTLTFFLGVVLAAGVMVPAFAQKPVPDDVPPYHWAYDALKQLFEDGLLNGYPDGSFRGQRPMSRYEFAVAIHQAYMKMMGNVSDLDGRINTIKGQIDDLMAKIDKMNTGGGGGGDTSNFATKQELQALKDQLEGLMRDTSSMKSWGDDIAALKKLSSTFEQDLASLGVDVEAYKKDLRSLGDRVTALESLKPAIMINGSFDFYGRAAHSRDDVWGIDWNGAPVGSRSNGQTIVPVGVQDDIHFMNELGLVFSGVYGRDVHFEAEVVGGNLLGFEGGSLTSQWNNGSTPPFPTRKEEGNEDVYLHHAEAAWNTKWLNNNVNVRLGRIGLQLSPYLLKRQDVDYYVDIKRWDDGNWYFDGGSVDFNWNTVDLNVFGGKTINRGSVNSANIYGMMVGDVRVFEDFFNNTGRPGNSLTGVLEVETMLGANLGIKLGDRGSLRGYYNILDGQDSTTTSGTTGKNVTFDRLNMIGGTLEFAVGKNIHVTGNFAQSAYFNRDSSQLNNDNWAADGMVTFNAGKLNVFGGYRMIGPYFSAPGSWGRIGYWNNPTDIQGFQVGAHLGLTEKVNVYASGEFYNGTGRASNGTNDVGLLNDDDITRIQAGVGFKLADNWHLGLGWEGVFWKLEPRNSLEFNGGDVDENYYTADFNYDLGAGTTWRLGYQISDYNNKTGDSGFNTPGNPSNRAKGGLFFTQFSLKF
jgi:hypothetical protein